jgi:hypothetical protein
MSGQVPVRAVIRATHVRADRIGKGPMLFNELGFFN